MADDWEDEAVNCSPEVGGVAYVVSVSSGHPLAVNEVERCKDVAGNRDGDEVDVNAYSWVKKHGGKEYRRYCTRCANRVVTLCVFIFYKVCQGADNYRGEIH